MIHFGKGVNRMNEKRFGKMTKAEWRWILAIYEAVIRLTPDKEAALDELDKLREAGPPKE